MLKSKVTFFRKRVKKSPLLMRLAKLEMSSSTDDFPSNLKTMIGSIVSFNLHAKVRNLTSKNPHNNGHTPQVSAGTFSMLFRN